jgi:hypothetical protein
MSVHLLNDPWPEFAVEPSQFLGELTAQLVEPSEQSRFDELVATRHYLGNATTVGAALRYLVKYHDHWCALLVFGSPAFHLKYREEWLQWDVRRLKERRHLVAQNTRFLVLAPAGRWPNLSSRALKLVCARLSADWQKEFGHPILAVETFVDPDRFRGTCYKAAGWHALGPTRGHGRNWRDFYTDTEHPKELWVRALTSRALEQLRAPILEASLIEYERPLPAPCPVPTPRLESLWEAFVRVQDARKARGKRYRLANVLTMIALAVMAGEKNPHGIFKFVSGLNHGQRRLLRCRPRRNKPGQFDVPCERTFRRLLKKVDPEALKDGLVAWMKTQDDQALEVLHLDGKVIKNANPAPAEHQPTEAAEAPAPAVEIPAEWQKPVADKALTLVNFLTTGQRLVDQIAVPQNTNEEAAVARYLPKMDLADVIVTVDAAHTIKANCRQLTQDSMADGVFILKGNQPKALAKAEQAFTGDFPPSGQHDR